MHRHLTLDESLSAFMTAAKTRAVVLARYDNPETDKDETWRILQPLHIIQTKENLLGLFWQHSPQRDYRSLRFHFFTHVIPTGFPSLCDARQTFTLDAVLTWAQSRALPTRAQPYDLRSSLRSKADRFYQQLLGPGDCHAHSPVPTLPPVPKGYEKLNR